MYQQSAISSTPPRTPRSVSLRWGLIAAGVMLLLSSVIIAFQSLHFGPIIVAICVLLIGAAGLLAARQTDRAGTGATAGLIAGAIGFLPLFGAATYLAISDTRTDTILTVIGALLVFVLLEALSIGIGAGLGALGGLIGCVFYHRAHPHLSQNFLPPLLTPYPPTQEHTPIFPRSPVN